MFWHHLQDQIRVHNRAWNLPVCCAPFNLHTEGLPGCSSPRGMVIHLPRSPSHLSIFTFCCINPALIPSGFTSARIARPQTPVLETGRVWQRLQGWRRRTEVFVPSSPVWLSCSSHYCEWLISVQVLIAPLFSRGKDTRPKRPLLR